MAQWQAALDELLREGKASGRISTVNLDDAIDQLTRQEAADKKKLRRTLLPKLLPREEENAKNAALDKKLDDEQDRQFEIFMANESAATERSANGTKLHTRCR